MPDELKKLEGVMREIAIRQLSRVGGRAWAEREVDTPAFIEMAEKIAADVMNRALDDDA